MASIAHRREPLVPSQTSTSLHSRASGRFCQAQSSVAERAGWSSGSLFLLTVVEDLDVCLRRASDIAKRE